MATFVQRKGPGGKRVWQALVRRQGYPQQTRTFDTKVAAEVWAGGIENEIGRGTFVSRAEAEGTTLSEALGRYAVEVSNKKRRAVLNPITFFPNRSIAFPIACFFFPSFLRRSLVP